MRLRMVRQGAQLRVTASDPSGSQAPRMLEIPIDSFVAEAEGEAPAAVPCHAKHQELCAMMMGHVCACSARQSQLPKPISTVSSHSGRPFVIPQTLLQAKAAVLEVPGSPS